MDVFELKKEQAKLSRKISLRDEVVRLSTVGGIACVPFEDKILASVVVCSYPSMALKESKHYILANPLPYRPGFQAYREMPAMIEAYNLLEEEPDVVMVKGLGVAHPRGIGVASHLGLALNKPTLGVTQKILFGRVEQGRIFMGSNMVGFEVKTREHANPVYVSPGHLTTLGSVLKIVQDSIQFPHKMPEPIHLAHKIAKKKFKKKNVPKPIKN